MFYLSSHRCAKSLINYFFLDLRFVDKKDELKFTLACPLRCRKNNEKYMAFPAICLERKIFLSTLKRHV